MQSPLAWQTPNPETLCCSTWDNGRFMRGPSTMWSPSPRDCTSHWLESHLGTPPKEPSAWLMPCWASKPLSPPPPQHHREVSALAHAAAPQIQTVCQGAQEMKPDKSSRHLNSNSSSLSTLREHLQASAWGQGGNAHHLSLPLQGLLAIQESWPHTWRN